jgi:hypothetical protein
MNLLCWGGLIRPGYETHKDLQRHMMQAFIEIHRGYLWKEVIAEQQETPDSAGFHAQDGRQPVGSARGLLHVAGDVIGNRSE